MRSLYVLLSSALFCSGAIVNTPANAIQHQDHRIVRGLPRNIAAAKAHINGLTNGHPAVMQQFDLFGDQLARTYKKGQGFIETDILRILDAAVFAAQKHYNQTRKDAEKTPYIIHPIGVAHSLMTIGNVRDPDILIAALLHDTVEDTQTTFEEIEGLFGARVTGFVREVTDDKSLPKPERKRLQIVNASHKSAGAAQIKLADKLYNLKDLTKATPEGWDQPRVDEYFKWAQQVVDNLPWVNAALKSAVDEMINSTLNK